MEILQTGIDISAYQRTMALSGAKAEGFTFAVIKAGGSDAGIYIDPWFERHYATAKALGIPVGAYWYMGAKTVEEARENARYMAEHCLKGKQFELPIYLDVEGSMLKLGKRLLTDIIHAWCQEMESLGYWAGIYATLSAFTAYVYDEELERYAHWVAQWSKTLSYNKSCCGLWQYGGETNLIRSNKVAGVVCDQDYMLVDYPTKIKAKGLNGFGKTESEPETPATPVSGEIDTTATNSLPTLKKGDKGGTVKAVQVLLHGYGCEEVGKADGIAGVKFLSAVAHFQQDNGLIVDGIVGAKTWAKLLGM